MSFMEVSNRVAWTMTDAARRLGEPQHRLIYLCEKGVVQPDVQDADGRGSSRRFSARNLLEFGVALRLRALGIPASVIGAVLYVLRGFESAMKRQLGEFSIPTSLTESGAPELKVIIGDDQRLYFTLASTKGSARTYGGVPLQDLLARAERVSGRNKGLRSVGTETKEGVLRARVEVSVTGIAHDLGLEA